MRNRLLAAFMVVAIAALLTMSPVVAEAAKLITGRDVKDSSLTGKDVKDRSLTGSDVKDSSLTGSDLKDSSVTGSDVKASSLDGTDLVDGTVGGADVTDGGLSGADVADGGLTGADVADGGLAGADVADGGLTGADVADGGLTGADVADGSVKGADVDESSLSSVPLANGLATLPSGQTQSGVFSAAGANSSGAAGWLGFAVNYPRPLATAIVDDNIIDTVSHPDLVHCPGVGQAAPGYLCLYFEDRSSVANAYGYSDDSFYSPLTTSIGVGLYLPVTGSVPYANGVWTVTAP